MEKRIQTQIPDKVGELRSLVRQYKDQGWRPQRGIKLKKVTRRAGNDGKHLATERCVAVDMVLKKEAKMKVQAWKIWITEGGISAAHGFYHQITEFYVPDLKMFINSAGCHRWEEGDTRYSSDTGKRASVLLGEMELEPDAAEQAKMLSKSLDVQAELMTVFSAFADVLDSRGSSSDGRTQSSQG